MNAPDVIEKRKDWLESLPELDKDKLVFLDESAVNTDMTRRYGRAVNGKRCFDKAPVNTPQSTTILSSVRLNGETSFTTYSGGTTVDKFKDYLENVLAPTLHNGDIVIMDNMRTHHAKAVKKVIDDLKIKVIFLPPYSPDFNPIEKMWSKIKSVLRKMKARSASDLADAIDTAFNLVSAEDCAGWFSSCFLGR